MRKRRSGHCGSAILTTRCDLYSRRLPAIRAQIGGTAVAPPTRMTSLRAGVAVVVVCLCSAAVHAQFDLADPSVSGPVSQEQEATLTFENRPILVLRARVVTRMPSDRAAAAVRLLQRLVARGVSGPVGGRAGAGAQGVAGGGGGGIGG